MRNVGDYLMVVRNRGLPPWKFIKTAHGHYECWQRVYAYRLMMGGLDDAKPIWIGKLVPGAIVTAEHEIKAKEVVFEFGTYQFAGGMFPRNMGN